MLEVRVAQRSPYADTFSLQRERFWLALSARARAFCLIAARLLEAVSLARGRSEGQALAALD